MAEFQAWKTDKPKTLKDCKVPLCPNCGWPEVDRDSNGERINVLSMTCEIVRRIELQTGVVVMWGFDYLGQLFVSAKKP